ncbi:YcxB family protein [Acinetobacter indicus]|uniref:YcxB family protein n=1 Tax=Acinetobacter indicus TaxID=756892 RepID=A0AAW8Z6E8_9GAMM|nr:YcxB family protein [Acinetobacter indicus]MCO8087386.1 YcxB family protein [Acinetobacter indicus]MDM1270356.1 YcxB family protein [Acinetobacter indicus]MDV4312519.1 YcxB family protein [Acinetobacter indicus]MDV4316647.1 YcxB family protein [Acinetobacter indicus]
MSELKPALSLRYFLNLEESQDGFALATFGKKQFTRFITPLISVGIIAWGIYLGLDGVGRYYLVLGVFFLVLQMLMRYWFLPMMFKRQFVKYQFGKSEQGIALYQDYAEISANGRDKVVHYNEVQNFASGKLTYMIELKNRMVIIVPKRVFESTADQTLFENTFKK